MANPHPSSKRYPPELKERAVRMYHEAVKEAGGERFGVVARVAQRLGIGAESLRGWIKQAEVDSGERTGTTSADKARITELEKEVRELRRANEILKRASAFFAAELDRPPK